MGILSRLREKAEVKKILENKEVADAIKATGISNPERFNTVSALEKAVGIAETLGIEIPTKALKLESAVEEREAEKETRGLVKGALGREAPELRLQRVTEEGKVFETIPSEAEAELERNRAAEQKKSVVIAGKQAERKVKIGELADKLDLYFQIADQIPTGEGLQRFIVGAQNRLQAFGQDTPTGVASAQLLNFNKNLRVDLAKLKDVGNLAVAEQEAAEMLLFSLSDSTKLRALKKAVLQDIASAKNDGSKVRATIKNWMQTPEFQELQTQGAQGTPQGRTITLPSGRTLQLGGQ